MSHDSNCERSTNLRCECSCKKDHHGERGAARVAPLFSNDFTAARNRRRLTEAARTAQERAKTESAARVVGPRQTDSLLTQIALWGFDNVDWKNEEFDAANDLLGAVVDKMNLVILDQKLSGVAASSMRTTLGSGHLICALCVFVLHLRSKGKEAVDAAVKAFAADLVHEMQLPTTVALLVRIALERVLSAGTEMLWTAVGLPRGVKVLQIVGVLECADWSHHESPGVYELCFLPIFKPALAQIQLDTLEEFFDPERIYGTAVGSETSIP